ncbi:MAG: DUF3592 domain-containing protein [Novosphingobium sp.]
MNQLALFGGYATILATTLPFVVIAGIFIVLATRVRRKQQAARDWPMTQGHVLTSDIQARTHTVGNTGGRSTAYYAHVVYQYRVGGADYVGNRMSPGAELGYGSRNRAMARAARYPVGAEVTVWYNPLDPNEAVLDLNAPRMTLLYWIGGCMLLFLLFSGAFAWGIVRFTSAIVGSVPH